LNIAEFVHSILGLVDRRPHGPRGGLELHVERRERHGLPKGKLKVRSIVFTQVVLTAQIDGV